MLPLNHLNNLLNNVLNVLNLVFMKYAGGCRTIFLKLNDDKTEFMLIGSRQQLSKLSIPHITIGDSEICPVSQARNLGTMFDSSMSLSSHISNIVRTASFHVRNIGKIRKYLTPDATEQIVHSVVTSRIDMGNSLLYGLPDTQIDRLQRIQNSAARVITLSKKFSHITPVLKELHWLPVRCRIVYKLMLFVYKALNDSAPSYITDLLETYNPPRQLRSSNVHRLNEPRSKRSWGDRAFSRAAPRLWNKLPSHVKSCSSLTQFKKALKTHLMSSAYL